MPVEQEVKLAFATSEAARLAVQTAGGRLAVSRRLLADQLYDTSDLMLRERGSSLRVRRDGTTGVLTWKGPTEASPVKSREEIETGVADPATMATILGALGYEVVFSSEKYREEFDLDDTHVVIDETPAGVYVEIEGTPETIGAVAAKLGRTPADYRLESYPRLWRRWCEARGLPMCDMLFAHADRRA